MRLRNFLPVVFVVAVIFALFYSGILHISFISEKQNGVDNDLADVGTDYSGVDDVDVPRDSKPYSPDEIENIQIYDQYSNSVVNITTEVLAYNWFLEPVPREGTSGSGSIIDERGYVLTNNHVVEGAYKVNITLSDSSDYEGEVVGSDPETDLAVVKFDPGGDPLVTIPFGRSDNLRVGQKVLAIGNPFAFERTLTTGIISGLGRPLKNDKGLVIRNLIQTDASINPGNSGGPLLNSEGELIGVNTMIYTLSGGSVGIGFAVPSATAKRVVPELIQNGYVVRGRIDVEMMQLFPSLVRYARLKVSRGLLVMKVAPGSNAQKAGIQGGDPRQAVRSGNNVIYLGGDIIVEVNEVKVGTLGELYSALEVTRPGDTVRVKLVRGNREIYRDLVLSERKKHI